MRYSQAIKASLIDVEHRAADRGVMPVPEPEGTDRRRFYRWQVSWPATLFHAGRVYDCDVLDFSQGGAQVNTDRVPAVGSEVLLKFPFTIFLKGRVIWRRGGNFGIGFDCAMRRSAKAVEEFLLERSVVC